MTQPSLPPSSAIVAEAHPPPPPPAPLLPAWAPPWASQLAELCFSGTTSVFLLHGNSNDLMPRGESPDDGYGTIADMLAEQLFGKWDLVLHYDLGRGLRAFCSSSTGSCARTSSQRATSRSASP